MNDKLETWALIELFGHARIAGLVTEQVVAGQGFVRCDVPAVGDHPAFTRMFGPGAIYSITPVSDEIGVALANRLNERPVNVYIGNLLPAAQEEEEDIDLDDIEDPDNPF